MVGAWHRAWLFHGEMERGGGGGANGCERDELRGRKEFEMERAVTEAGAQLSRAARRES